LFYQGWPWIHYLCQGWPWNRDLPASLC
jgi:hypothetical protein